LGQKSRTSVTEKTLPPRITEEITRKIRETIRVKARNEYIYDGRAGSIRLFYSVLYLKKTQPHFTKKWIMCIIFQAKNNLITCLDFQFLNDQICGV
jgi:hypothetical protein